jgi:putative ABC transport system permease protein
MEYTEIIKSAFQALQRNILRTGLTMLGIIIGITSVILIYSIGQGAVKFITDELTSFGIDYFQINPGKSQFSTFAGSQSLTFEDLDAIKTDTSLTNIKAVAPLAMASMPVSANGEEDEFIIYGVTPEMLDILRPDVIEGEFITTEQVETNEKVIVMGITAAEKLFGEDTSPLDESVRISGGVYKVTGMVESTSVLAGGILNKAVFIPIDVLINDIVGEEKLQEIDISVHDPKQINQTMDDVEALLRERHNLDETDENDFQLQSAQDMLTTVQTITGLLTAMIVAISGISLVVGGVGVMNIMLVSVTERTRE